MNIYTETYENIYKFLHSEQLHEDTAKQLIQKLLKSAWLLHKTRRDANVIRSIARTVARKSSIVLTAKQLWDLYYIIKSNKKQQEILDQYEVDSVNIPLDTPGGKKVGTTRRSHRTTRPMKDK